MKIEFEGRTWQIDPDDISNREAAAICAHTGLSVSKWLDDLEKEGEPAKFLPAWESLYWLMLKQNPETAADIGQEHVAISDVDFPLYKFATVFMEALQALVPPTEVAEPDPTRRPVASARSPGPSSRKASSGRGGGVKPHG